MRLRSWVPENSHAAAPSRDAPHPPTDRGFRSTGRWRGVPPTKSVFVVRVYSVTGCSRRNNNNIIHARCRCVVVPDTSTVSQSFRVLRRRRCRRRCRRRRPLDRYQWAFFIFFLCAIPVYYFNSFSVRPRMYDIASSGWIKYIEFDIVLSNYPPSVELRGTWNRLMISYLVSSRW